MAEAVIDIAPDAVLYIADPDSKGDLRELSIGWFHKAYRSSVCRSVGPLTVPATACLLTPIAHSTLLTGPWLQESLGSMPAATKGAASGMAPLPTPTVTGFTSGFQGMEGRLFSCRKAGALPFNCAGRIAGPEHPDDLALFITDSVTGQVLAARQDPQSGGPGHHPYEGLRFEAPYDGFFAIFAGQISGSAPGWIQLILWGPDLEHYTDHHNMYSVEESANPGMLAVGAAHYWDTNTISPSSSLWTYY